MENLFYYHARSLLAIDIFYEWHWHVESAEQSALPTLGRRERKKQLLELLLAATYDSCLAVHSAARDPASFHEAWIVLNEW